jgi:hypothetical protein
MGFGHSHFRRCSIRPGGEYRLCSGAFFFARNVPIPKVASNRALAVCEDLRPAQNANRAPQSGWPKRIFSHERIDGVGAVSLDDPQPTGWIT